MLCIPKNLESICSKVFFWVKQCISCLSNVEFPLTKSTRRQLWELPRIHYSHLATERSPLTQAAYMYRKQYLPGFLFAAASWCKTVIATRRASHIFTLATQTNLSIISTGCCNEVALVKRTLNTKCGRIVGARKLPADFSVGGFSVADLSAIFQMPKTLPVDFSAPLNLLVTFSMLKNLPPPKIHPSILRLTIPNSELSPMHIYEWNWWYSNNKNVKIVSTY